MMAEKEIEVFETTTRRVTDVLKRLGVAKERMVTVITEPDGWRAISSIRTAAARSLPVAGVPLKRDGQFARHGIAA